MLFGVCIGPSFSLAKKQLLSIIPYVDGVEIRLDLLNPHALRSLKELLSLWNKKIIITFGPCSKVSLQKLHTILISSPDYIDLPWDSDETELGRLREYFPSTKLILSYHDFTETKDLNIYFEKIQSRSPDVIKIATKANTSLDSLQMLTLSCRARDENKPFIGLCMGDLGKITRILSKIVGNELTFGSWDAFRSAPGQIDIKDMIHTYRYNHLSESTKVFTLIGEHISQSLSPTIHNFIFSTSSTKAIYVSLPLQRGELSSFLEFFKQLPFFSGASITTPFKEEVLLRSEGMASSVQSIGAANTLSKEAGTILLANTDGIGALKSVQAELDLAGKTVLILGAGGTARALAFSFAPWAEKVAIAARSDQKAYQLASVIGCSWSSWEQVGKNKWDVIINATSSTNPLSLSTFSCGDIVMDCNYNPRVTAFLHQGQAKGFLAIEGLRMLIYQAIEQQKIWMKREIPISFHQIHEMLESLG